MAVSSEKSKSIEKLYHACNENPQSLDDHVALSRALKADNQREKLRECRVEFSQKSALPSKLWREWIVDEIKAQREKEDDEEEENGRGFVTTLCELALADFQDVGVWLTYLEVATGVALDDDGDDSDDDSDDEDEDENLADSRSLFEEALSSIGMHFSQGSKIWKMYFNFEMRQYRKQVKQGVNIQVAAEPLVKLFERQLCLPLKDNNLVIKSACKFLSKVFDKDALEKVMKALEKSHELSSKLRLKCEPYEVAIASATTSLNNSKKQSIDNLDMQTETVIKKWFEYISCLTKLQEIPLVLCCYERAVSQLPLQPKLWEAYLKFTLKDLKDAKISLPVAKRATRNVPFVSDFHCQYLRLVELCHMEETSDINTTVFNAVQFALNCKLGDVGSYFDVILSYCDYCRRRVSKLFRDEENTVESMVSAVVSLREAFESGLQCLEQYSDAHRNQGGSHRSLNKCKLKLYLYYIKMEDNLVCEILNDYQMTYQTICQLFERCIDAVGDSDSTPWIMYAEFESRQKHSTCGSSERKIYERGFDELSADEEGEETTSIKKKKKKSAIKDEKERNKMKLIELLKLCESWLMMERESGSVSSFEETKQLIQDTKQQLSLSKKAHVELDEWEANIDLTTKKVKEATNQKVSKGNKRKIDENSPDTSVDGHYREAAETVAKKTKVEGKSTSYQPIKFEKAKEDTSEGKCEVENKDSNEMLSPEDQEEINKSLFLTNLPFDVTKEEVESMFCDSEMVDESREPIQDVSLLVNKAGRFRGMATVTFTSSDIANLKLETLGENFMYQNRMISLSKSTKQHLRKRTTSHEGNTSMKESLIPYHAETLFVKGLDVKCDNDELRSMFTEFGSVIEARILKERFTKKSKGEGLVQFESASTVQLILSKPLPEALSLAGISVEKSRFPAVLKSKAPPTTKKNNPYLNKSKATTAVSSKPLTANAVNAAKTTKRASSVFSFIPRTLRK